METGLKTVNQQRKLGEWADRVSDYQKSGLSVWAWCRENGVSEQTYYRWPRRLYELAQNQQENRFAEVTLLVLNRSVIAVTLQFGGMESLPSTTAQTPPQ